jgi:transcriptional regulator with XRE-family HTH domain
MAHTPMSESPVETGPPLLGRRLREAREEQGIGLRTLAKRLSVSASLISQVERGKVMPSVGTLYAIVRELDISMDDLFYDGPAAKGRPQREEYSGPVQRSDVRDVIYLASGVRWERLSVEPDPDLDFQIVTYDVGAESCPSDALMTHEGKEFGYVLEGRLMMTIGDESYELVPGDSVSFTSTTPHRLANVGTEPMLAIWVVIGRERDSRFVP